LFIADLELINNEGWMEAIKQNISIPFMLLAYPLSLFLKSFIALRIVNCIILILLLFYFYKINKKRDLLFYSYILFYISTIGFFYTGINDVLFIVALVVFLNGVYRLANNKPTSIHWMLTALVLAFFTRQLFMVFLPVILFSLYVIYRSKIKFNKKILIPSFVFIFFLLVNLPSIMENGTLSYDKKSPPETMNVTWAQHQYLAQIMVNNGELKNGQHPSWEQTQQYIKLHGEESLPNGILKGITQDYQLTIKEFFKDFVYSILAMLMIFSFIIISYVELRWLTPVFIMTIVFYDDLEKEKRIAIKLVSLNYLTLISFSIYGIIKLLNKIYL
jgi:hypothetical protein